MSKVRVALIVLLVIFSVGATVFILVSNIKQKIETQSMPLDNVEEKAVSEQLYYPLAKGNRWEYEVSKREQQSEGSISATKEKEVVEVIGVQQDDLGEAFTIERRNKVDVTGKETLETETWLVRGRTIYDFKGGKISEDTIAYPFPFYVGQRWGDDDASLRFRDDGLYNWKVESKFPLKVLGKDYPECFRLVHNTLADSMYKIFCYDLGVVEEAYAHSGTTQEVKKKLINILLR